MPVSLLVARLVLAAVLVVAGCAKLADLAGSREAVRAFGVPSMLAPITAVALPVVELLVAVALLPRVSARWGGLAALILLVVFAVAIASALRRDVTPDCHCFGQLHSRPVGVATLVRNVTLAALAGFVLVAGWRDSGLSVSTPLAGLGAGAAAGIAVGLALAAALALALWLIAGVLRQQGRLIHRLEAVEAAIGLDPGAAGAGVAGTLTLGLAVGERAPDPCLLDTAGDEHLPSSLLSAGLPLLLVFTDSTCGPCNALLPDVARWQRRYAETVSVVLVASGSVDAARAKSEEHQVTGVLVDPERRAFRAFGIQGTPSAVLLDGAGRVASPVAGGAAAVRVLVDRAGRGTPAAGPGGVDAVWTLSVGDRLPAMTLTDPSGGRVDIADGASESRLILLWDPHCPYCQRLLPELRARAARHRALPGLTIVVNRGAAADELDDLPARILFDPLAQLMTMLGAHGTPSAVPLDGAGRIASSPLVGGPAILAALNQELAPGDDLRVAPELEVQEPVSG